MNTTLRALFTSAYSAVDHDRPAIVAEEASMTYGELYRAALSLVGWFDAAGVTAGARVALMTRNCPEYVVADLAVNLIGATKIPLNEMLSDDDVAFMIDDCEPVVCVADAGRAALLRHRTTTHTVSHVITIDGDDGGPAGHGSPGSPPTEVSWDTAMSYTPPALQDVAERAIDADGAGLILYTGGTTGRPKGVVHSQRSLAANMLVHRIETSMDESDRLLVTSPLPHSAGFLLQTTLLSGGTAYVRKGFDVDDVLTMIESERITVLFMVPTMLYRILDALKPRPRDTGSVRAIIYGAAPMALARLHEGLDRFGEVFMQLYGQSEAPNFLTRLPQADHRIERGHLGSCGRPCATVELMTVDPESGARTAPGVPGEVVARSAFTMTGYLGLPDATASTVVDGWLHTGDVGYLDDDGYLYIVDRIKDMVISGGMNVYTTEVEQALAECPGVSYAAVIGLPDADWGERVCAVVVPDADRYSEAAVDAHCRKHLSAYKRPKEYVVLGALPLTNYGKVDKKKLVSMVKSGS